MLHRIRLENDEEVLRGVMKLKLSYVVADSQVKNNSSGWVTLYYIYIWSKITLLVTMIYPPLLSSSIHIALLLRRSFLNLPESAGIKVRSQNSFAFGFRFVGSFRIVVVGFCYLLRSLIGDIYVLLTLTGMFTYVQCEFQLYIVGIPL